MAEPHSWFEVGLIAGMEGAYALFGELLAALLFAHIGMTEMQIGSVRRGWRAGCEMRRQRQHSFEREEPTREPQP